MGSLRCASAEAGPLLGLLRGVAPGGIHGRRSARVGGPGECVHSPSLALGPWFASRGPVWGAHHTIPADTVKVSLRLGPKSVPWPLASGSFPLRVLQEKARTRLVLVAASRMASKCGPSVVATTYDTGRKRTWGHTWTHPGHPGHSPGSPGAQHPGLLSLASNSLAPPGRPTVLWPLDQLGWTPSSGHGQAAQPPCRSGLFWWLRTETRLPGTDGKEERTGSSKCTTPGHISTPSALAFLP